MKTTIESAVERGHSHAFISSYSSQVAVHKADFQRSQLLALVLLNPLSTLSLPPLSFVFLNIYSTRPCLPIMRPTSVLYTSLFASSTCALSLDHRKRHFTPACSPTTDITTAKLVRVWKDLDPNLNLPTIHLDTPRPVAVPERLPAVYGFSWADEEQGRKRSLDDKYDDPDHDPPHKGSLFCGIDPGLLKLPLPPLPSRTNGLIFGDVPLRKRGLFDGIDLDPLEAPDSTKSLT